MSWELPYEAHSVKFLPNYVKHIATVLLRKFFLKICSPKIGLAVVISEAVNAVLVTCTVTKGSILTIHLSINHGMVHVVAIATVTPLIPLESDNSYRLH